MICVNLVSRRCIWYFCLTYVSVIQFSSLTLNAIETTPSAKSTLFSPLFPISNPSIHPPSTIYYSSITPFVTHLDHTPQSRPPPTVYGLGRHTTKTKLDLTRNVHILLQQVTHGQIEMDRPKGL